MVKSALLAFTLLGLNVAVQSFVITFSTPQQCGVVEIAWTKPSSSAAQLIFPLLLHILPFDSTAVTQDIYGWNASMTSGSATVNFNLTGGTQFLLAVTDQTGQGAGPVSEVKTAGSSQDTSCLSTSTPGPGHFQVFTTLNSSLCPSLTVDWDGTVKSPRPTVLGFSPGQLPVNMDPPSSGTPVERTITTDGTFTSLSQVVVLFRDENSLGRTSQFLTVGGTDQNGCSNPSATTMGTWESTTPSAPACQQQTSSNSSNDAGKVIGGVSAGVVGLAIVLFAILAYRQRRIRAAKGLIPHSQKSEKPDATAPVTSDAPNSDDLPEFPMQPTSNLPPPVLSVDTRPEALRDQGLVTSPSSSPPVARAGPVTFPKSPSARRRSWVSRSRPSTGTEETNFLSLGDGQSITQEDPEPRPDSPTLPDVRSLRHVSVPTTPVTASRPRSQRSEKRAQYIMLESAPNIQVSGEIRSPRSASSQRSRTSRTSRTKKVH